MSKPQELITPQKRRSQWRTYMPLLGLALFVWVLLRVDGTAMMKSLQPLSGRSLALAITYFSINILIKAVRWRRMLSAQGLTLSTSTAIAAYLNGQFYGQVTVGRLGEFYRAEALIEQNISFGRAMSSCLFDRLIDIFIVLTLAVVLGAFVVGNMRAALLAAGLLAVLASCGYLILAAIKYNFLPKSTQSLLDSVLRRLEKKKMLARLIKEVSDLLQGATFLVKPFPLLETLVWSVIAWTGYFATLWQLTSGIGLDISPLLQTAAASLAALSALIPITISGLGVRETVFAKVLGIEGASLENAVVLALMNLAVMVVSTLSLGIIGLIWRSRQQMTSNLANGE